SALGETELKAGAGLGIKEPTMLESFSVSPYFLGNPDLKPERMRSAELGIVQRFAAERAKVELTYFDNLSRDVISLLTTNPRTYEARYANIGRTRARGLEWGAAVAPTRALRAHASYTLLQSAIKAAMRASGILSIDNLTNAAYSAQFGYQPLGRVVRAGVRLAF